MGEGLKKIYDPKHGNRMKIKEAENSRQKYVKNEGREGEKERERRKSN